jgi:hypothetical protein
MGVSFAWLDAGRRTALPSSRMNRRALLVLLVTFGGAAAVMAWLRAEMRTAAASQGESAATIPGSRSPPEPRAK